MTGEVEVTLQVTIEIDDDYSTAEHAADIVATAEWLFSEGTVALVDVQARRHENDVSADSASSG